MLKDENIVHKIKKILSSEEFNNNLELFENKFQNSLLKPISKSFLYSIVKISNI